MTTFLRIVPPYSQNAGDASAYVTAWRPLAYHVSQLLYSYQNKYAMTLSELLHSVSFDDLIPTLKEVYGVETDIYAYREAFDELNLLRPIGRDEDS